MWITLSLWYKVLFYFYAMKTIKVSDKAQQELKIFAAKVQYNMDVVASDAILKYIREHKAVKQSPKK